MEGSAGNEGEAQDTRGDYGLNYLVLGEVVRN